MFSVSFELDFPPVGRRKHLKRKDPFQELARRMQLYEQAQQAQNGMQLLEENAARAPEWMDLQSAPWISENPFYTIITKTPIPKS